MSTTLIAFGYVLTLGAGIGFGVLIGSNLGPQPEGRHRAQRRPEPTAEPKPQAKPKREPKPSRKSQAFKVRSKVSRIIRHPEPTAAPPVIAEAMDAADNGATVLIPRVDPDATAVIATVPAPVEEVAA